MNGVRLLYGAGSSMNFYGTKLMKTSQCGSKSVQFMVSRVYSQQGKETVWRTTRTQGRKTFSERLTQPTTTGTPISIGQGAVAGGAVFGLGALCYYGLGLSNEVGALENSRLWPEYVRARIRDTYMYFGSSVVLTAGSAVAIFRSPAMMQLVSKNSWLAIGASMAAVLGTGILAQSIPYSPGLGAKQVAWALHTSVIGAVIAPICMVGGPILARAALYTLGIVGGLSAVAVCAPSDRFLTMGGPLAIGMGVVFVSSIGSMFIPPVSTLGLSLMSVSLYGGLLLFSGFLLYDTQRIIRMAETHPTYAAVPYDPVNASISIYLDTLNIFLRIVTMLAMGNNKKR